MITNPPFGVSWKSDEAAVKADAQTAIGRFSAGTPRSSDGALLFLQHMLSKMEDRGSRIGIVLTGRHSLPGMPVAVRVKSDAGLSKTTG